MNDSTQKELKIIVERTVRPIRAVLARKRKMREELLAHLISIFDEEVEKLGDEQAAFDEARKRFGDPKDLSAELQRTVPRSDRLVSVVDWCNRRLFYQPGESLLRLAARHLWVMGGGEALAMLLLGLTVVILRGRFAEVELIFRMSLTVGLVAAALSFLVATVPYEIGRSLYGRNSERSVRRAGFYGLMSLFVFPAIAFFVYWGLTYDLPGSLAHLRFACLFAPAGPVVLVAASRTMLDERRFVEDWASLQIDQQPPA